VRSIGLRMKHLILVLLTSIPALAAPWKFPCPENEIATYTALRVSETIAVDGRLDEPAWKASPR